MMRTNHSHRTTGGSIRALTLALLVVASALAPGMALADGGATSAEHFAVTIDGTNSPVTEGDTLTVTATVENTGEVGGSQEISLAIDREEIDHRTVELAAGESTTVELSWDTGLGDGGNHTATVASANDTDSTDVRVQESADFSVAIESTSSPVTAGDTLTVTGTVENTGDVSGTHNVSLLVGDIERDVRELSLEPGESTTVELAWATSSGDEGNYTATMLSPHDSESTDVQVRSSSFFAVSNLSTNAPVVEGETLTVTATVENTGDEHDTQGISLTVGGEVRDETSLSLSPDESTAVELTWTTSAGDAGEHTATVASPNDTDSTAVVVESGSASGTATFTMDDNVAETYLGDVADIGVYLNATNTTTLEIGGQDHNYHVTMTVVDEDGDGTVTVLWNTHLAGQTADESEAWHAAGSDHITDVDRTTGSLDGPIEPTEYSISLSVADSETGLGLASVFAPLAVNRTIGVGSGPGARSVNTLSKNVTNFNAVSTDTTDTTAIARGDWVLLRIDAAGIQGYIDGPEDLAGDGTEGVSLSITETSTGPNEEQDKVSVDSFVTHDFGFANATFVLVADTSSDDFELGETYEANFVISEENPYVDERVVRTSSFRVEKPSARIRTVDGRVEVPNDNSSTIHGTTNVAAGTNLTVSIVSDGEGDAGGEPFELTETTTVRNNTWSTTFDLSGKPDGQSFTVTLRHGDTGELLAEREGVVVDNARPSLTFRNNTVRNNTVVGESATFSVEASDPDGSIAAYEWKIDGEPAGTGDSLTHTFETAGEHEVTVVVTDDEGASTTASRTVVVNAPPSASIPEFSPTKGEGVTVEPEVSDPDGTIESYQWRVDGEVVSESRTLTYTFEAAGEYEVSVRVTDDRGATATASRTVVVGPLDGPTATDDGTPAGVGTPGFGAGAALVALAGATLLYGRRR